MVVLALLAGVPCATGSQDACDTQRLVPPSITGNGSFGLDLVLDGRWLAVTDPQALSLCPTPSVCWAGAVYMFEPDADGRWALRQTLLSSDLARGDNFGTSVAVDGDRLIAGAWFGDTGELDAGSAYVFEFDGEQWVETAAIPPVEPRYQAAFGRAVALDGRLALIQQGYDVWVFEETPDGWIPRESLRPPDEPTGSLAYGFPLVLTDDWLFVGAHMDESRGSQGGSVYIFQRNGFEFTFHGKLYPPDPESSPRYGLYVAFDDPTLVVGGAFSDRRFEAQGAAYVYEFLEGEWQLTQELMHDDPIGSDTFGQVAIHGDTMLIGAALQPVSPIGVGAAYLFRRGPYGLWRQADKLLPDTPFSAPFGGSVAIDNRWAVAGAWNELVGDHAPGAAHAFDLSCYLCPPDLDADGTLTIYDFLTFLNLFDAGDPQADFDGDGELTIFDFLAFQTAFDAGCG